VNSFLAKCPFLLNHISPEIDPFCRHATIATGVFLGETGGHGTYILETAVERFLFPFAFKMTKTDLEKLYNFGHFG